MNDRLECVTTLLANVPRLDGARIRCCAWLLRGAIDEVVTRLCGEGPSMHALLLSLPARVDADVAQDTSRIWCALDRVMRHHDYELTPTPEELRGWHADVGALVATLTADSLTLSGTIEL